jgi:tetratricopeptide (TPR) repeat protein
MIKINKKQKILLVILGMILALIFLEMFLRFGGFIILSIQNSKNRVTSDSIENDETYRILCLGESTTASIGLNEKSWPEFLEEELNKKNQVKFKVFNEGIDGTNTMIITSELEENIKRYKPDMIITMMGINDILDRYYYDDTLISRIIQIVKNIRVYKLYKLIEEHLSEKLNSYIYRNSINKSLELLDEGLENERKGNLELAKECYNKSLEIYPKNDKSLEFLGLLYLEEENIGKAKYYLKKAVESNPNNYGAYNSLFSLYEKENKERVIKENKIFYLSKKNIEYTKFHYQKIYNITKERGIKLVVMQYPTRDIEDFKDYFNEEQQKDIIFIENKDNFEKALEKYGYDKIFFDKFAWSIGYNFGHCTERGNKLIAENVANIILE